MGERPSMEYCIERYREHLIENADTEEDRLRYEDMSDWEIQDMMQGEAENLAYDNYRDSQP